MQVEEEGERVPVRRFPHHPVRRALQLVVAQHLHLEKKRGDFCYGLIAYLRGAAYPARRLHLYDIADVDDDAAAGGAPPVPSGRR